MKPAGRTILLGILMLWISVLVCAEPVSQLHPTDYVNDFAHVLDQTTIAQLDNICQQIDQKAHAQIAVVTINSLDGWDIESYAVDLFDQGRGMGRRPSWRRRWISADWRRQLRRRRSEWKLVGRSDAVFSRRSLP